ncbi:MAG TPA: hypothetical protein PLY90_11200 [Candidatus Hydrogenedentes bacterium]|nr:hypothetical protein [Candidatus Hydrogenedentota bacterium]
MILTTLSYLHPETRESVVRALGTERCLLYCPASETARFLSTEIHQQQPAPLETANEASQVFSLPGYSSVRLDYRKRITAGLQDSLFAEVSDSNPAPDDPDSDAFFRGQQDLFHLSLGDALQAEHEKEALLVTQLAPLIESGSSAKGLTEAMRILDELAVSLGRGNRPGSYLTSLKEKIHKLAEEKKQTVSMPSELFAVAKTLKENRCRLKELGSRRAALQKQIDLLTARNVKNLEKEIADLESARDALGTTPLLSSEQMAELNRMTTLVKTVQCQLEKTGDELRLVQEKLELLPGESSHKYKAPATYPEALERSIRQTSNKIAENEVRLDEIQQQMDREDRFITQAQAELSSLPDFSKLPPDPADFLNIVLQSCKNAIEEQKNEAERCASLEKELDRLQRAWEIHGPIFEQAGDFTSIMVQNEQKRKAARERYPLIAEEVDKKQSIRDEQQDFQQSQQWLAIGCFLLMCGAAGAYFFLEKTPILLVVAALLICVVYFFLHAFFADRQVRNLNQAIAEDHAELDLLQETINHRDTYIEDLMQQLGCQSPRELSTLYENHREITQQIIDTSKEVEQARQLCLECEERVPALFETLCAHLALVGKVPESTSIMDSYVADAIANYRRCKDVKLQLANRQNCRQSLFARKTFFDNEQHAQRDKFNQQMEQFRTLMRENGFTQEVVYTELDDLCANYRSFLDDALTSMDSSELLARQAQKLQERERNDREQLARYEEQRQTLLKALGFSTLEEAAEAGDQGAKFKAIQAEIDLLKAKLNTYRQGPIRVQGELLLPEGLAGDEEEGALRQLNASLNQVEKECAAVRQRWQDAWLRYSRLTTEQRPSGVIAEELLWTEKNLQQVQKIISAGALVVSLIQESLLTGRPERCALIAARATELLQTAGLSSARVQIALNAEGKASITAHADTATEMPSPLTLYMAVKIAAALVLAGEAGNRLFIVDAALQQEELPAGTDEFFTLLDALPRHWQTLVVTANRTLVEAGAARGWQTQNL